MRNYKFKVKRNASKNIIGMRVMFKKCNKCGEILFRDKFYKDKSHPSGLVARCIECKNSKYTHTCEQCGKEFKSKAKEQRFCSFECQGKWQTETRTGENSSNWQGGKITISCSYCGKEIELYKNRIKRSKNFFCSTECHGLWKSENQVGENNANYNKDSHIKCNCDYCNKEFETTKTKYNKSKNHFCSSECCNKWNNKKVKCNCNYCGKEFEVKKSLYNNNGNNYCSKECYNKSREENGRVKCNCAYCNKELNVKKSQYNNGNNFCDKDCYNKFNRGENHPRYNPNLTDKERDKERKIIKGYTEAVKETYERDNYTCQCCGKKGGNLNAHHIYGYAEYKDLRTDIDNLVTLCEDCHKKYHKQYGYKNNNYKDFRTFLYNEMMKQNTLEARLFYINTIEDITLRLEIRGLLELKSA